MITTAAHNLLPCRGATREFGLPAIRRNVLLLLAILLLPPFLTRAYGGPCKRLCKRAVQRCVNAGHTRGSCKRQLIPACKVAGRTACDEAFLPPTTTTTTSTTTSSTTATTSAPAVPDLTGTWSFTGFLAASPNVPCGEEACPGDPETFITLLRITQEEGPKLTASLGGEVPPLTGGFLIPPPPPGQPEFTLKSAVYTTSDVLMCRAQY